MDSNPNSKKNISDNAPVQERQQFQIKTLNKFDLIADDSEEDRLLDSNAAVVSKAEAGDNPWFTKFEVQQSSKAVRRKHGANES
jgi:hypothetical protein